VEWVRSEEKNRTEERDHDVNFSVAKLVFDDPLAVTRPDSHPDGDRWQTIGSVKSVLLFVVHTGREEDESIGRIISARKASARERKAYEEGRF